MGRKRADCGAALLERSEFAAALDDALAGVGAGAGRVVLVSGEAGIGKSALVRAFCDVHGADARACSGAHATRCNAEASRSADRHRGDGAWRCPGVGLREREAARAVFLALVGLRASRPTIAVIEDRRTGRTRQRSMSSGCSRGGRSRSAHWWS
jgi:hypothetical protein